MKVIATTRNVQGTGASRRLRRADKLPGIVYGGKEPATPIELEHNPIFYALRKEKFHASILTMELDGKEVAWTDLLAGADVTRRSFFLTVWNFLRSLVKG